jgi:hypothetical protein
MPDRDKTIGDYADIALSVNRSVEALSNAGSGASVQSPVIRLVNNLSSPVTISSPADAIGRAWIAPELTGSAPFAQARDPVISLAVSMASAHAAQQAGALVVLPTSRDFPTVSLGGGVLDEWPGLSAVLDADRLINVPIVKHHSLTRMTAGMKNLYGILGGRRNLLHQRIDQSIFDLGSFFRPTLVVVDAIRVLLRNGPQGGSFQDVKEVGQLAATTDPVAADAWAATFLGLPPAELGWIRLAHGVLGRHDLQRVREVV